MDVDRLKQHCQYAKFAAERDSLDEYREKRRIALNACNRAFHHGGGEEFRSMIAELKEGVAKLKYSGPETDRQRKQAANKRQEDYKYFFDLIDNGTLEEQWSYYGEHWRALRVRESNRGLWSYLNTRSLETAVGFLVFNVFLYNQKLFENE